MSTMIAGIVAPRGASHVEHGGSPARYLPRSKSRHVAFGTAVGLEAVAHALLRSVPHQYKRRGVVITADRSHPLMFPSPKFALHYYLEVRCESKAGRLTIALLGHRETYRVGLYWDGLANARESVNYESVEQLGLRITAFLKGIKSQRA